MKVLASRSQRVFPISECEPLQDDCAHRGLFFSTVHVKTSSTTTLGASPEPPPSPDSRSSRDGWLPKPRHDRRPRVDSSPAYLTAAHTVKQFKMACKRAQQRWSGLLRRIAKQVRALYVLCAHANACYKDAKCLPHANSSLRSPRARRRVLAQLQRRRFMLLSVRDALRAAPRSRAGLQSPRVGRRRRRRTLLCHLLFSVHAVAGMHAKMGTLLHAALPSQHKQLAIVLRTM